MGDYNYHEVEGVLNVPVNDVLKLRFGVQHKSRDGYLTNRSGIGPEDFDDLGYTTVRASALLNITNGLKNYTIFSYLNSDRNGDLGVLTAASGNPALGFLGALFGAPGAGAIEGRRPGEWLGLLRLPAEFDGGPFLPRGLADHQHDDLAGVG